MRGKELQEDGGRRLAVARRRFAYSLVALGLGIVGFVVLASAPLARGVWAQLLTAGVAVSSLLVFFGGLAVYATAKELRAAKRVEALETSRAAPQAWGAEPRAQALDEFPPMDVEGAAAYLAARFEAWRRLWPVAVGGGAVGAVLVLLAAAMPFAFSGRDRDAAILVAMGTAVAGLGSVTVGFLLAHAASRTALFVAAAITGGLGVALGIFVLAHPAALLLGIGSVGLIVHACALLGGAAALSRVRRLRPAPETQQTLDGLAGKIRGSAAQSPSPELVRFRVERSWEWTGKLYGKVAFFASKRHLFAGPAMLLARPADIRFLDFDRQRLEAGEDDWMPAVLSIAGATARAIVRGPDLRRLVEWKTQADASAKGSA